MRKSQTPKIIMVGALCCVFSTACSGGGGGGMGQSVATAANTASASQPIGPDSSDTGIAGAVAAPAAATFATAPAQLATAGGPSFDGSSGSYPTNVTFPLLISGLQKTSTGLSPTPSDPAATLTVVFSSPNFSDTWMVIPSLGVNQQIQLNTSLAGGGDTRDIIYGLSYVATGGWWVRPSGTNNPYSLTSDSEYVFGFEPPQAAMPASGTAVFSGPGLVTATVYKTVGTEIQASNPIVGNASITANFGSGAINGSFTQMKVTNTENWNDVSVTANLATGSNRISGTTAAAQAPGTPMSLSGSATGSINGTFYGPAVQELGAVWWLSDGTGSAIGTVVAGH